MLTHHSSEERLMASIAHASVVVFGPGILIGILIWLTQKEKSPYASDQGLQAAVYQLIGMIVIMAMWFIWGIFYALTWIPLIQDMEKFEDAPPPIFWIGLASMIVPFLVMFLWAVYGLWGALRTLRGRDFRYAILWKLLQSDRDG
jgi:uncharacterized Tic20 family protein